MNTADQKPWNLAYPELYEREKSTMFTRYPQFTEVIGQNGRIDGWTGQVTPVKSVGEKFLLHAFYLSDFPPSIPQVRVIRPDIFRLYRQWNHQHFYADGRICSFFPPDKSWVAEKNTMADIIDYACIWLVCHLYWKRHGVWPVKSVDEHNEDKLKKMLKPTDICYCPSGKKFKDCHMR